MEKDSYHFKTKYNTQYVNDDTEQKVKFLRERVEKLEAIAKQHAGVTTTCIRCGVHNQEVKIYSFGNREFSIWCCALCHACAEEAGKKLNEYTRVNYANIEPV